jgi:hypothetical protein
MILILRVSFAFNKQQNKERNCHAVVVSIPETEMAGGCGNAAIFSFLSNIEAGRRRQPTQDKVAAVNLNF